MAAGLSYWDEGIVTSVYHLQQVAATTGDADLIARAHDLQLRLQNQWFPVVQALGIKGDALQLGYELAQRTGQGSVNSSQTLLYGNETTPNSSANVLYDLDTTAGGQVGTAQQEAFVGGDVGANLSALGDDLSSSASDLGKVGHVVASQTTKLLYLLAVLLVALVALYGFNTVRRVL